jgi:hypothetical protein
VNEQGKSDGSRLDAMPVLRASGLVEHKGKMDPSLFKRRIMMRPDMTSVLSFPHPLHLMVAILLMQGNCPPLLVEQ